MDDGWTACADIVRRGDPDRFRATMAAPPAARARLFPVYAFNVEVARAPWVTQEPMIAEMRLQWWADVLSEIRGGGPVRRHEVATPLAAVLDAAGADLLDPLIDARQWDIYREPFQNIEHFQDYIRRTSGKLLLAAVRTLGDAPEEPVQDAGHALGLANWLRAVPALERAGRIPLVDGRPEAVRALAEDGLDRLDRARAGYHSIPKEIRPALLPLWQARTILRAAARDPARVAQGRLDPPQALSRLRLIAAAATGRW